jgi:hypothetical protein
MRKTSFVEKIATTTDNLLTVVHLKNPVEGYDLIDLVLPKDNKITIATFHSYGTTEPMKTHVYVVKTEISKDDMNCKGQTHQFCVPKTHKRCNIGLGVGAVSVSPRNSSRWLLTGIAVQSPKCGELEQEHDPTQSDIFIKIEERVFPFIQQFLKK